MPNDLPFTAVGNTTAPAELRFTQSGVAVASFTIAHTPRYFDQQSNEWKDRDALFIRCSVWRDQAENIAQTLAEKGVRVIASGVLRANVWQDKEGNDRRDFELVVDEIGPSLRYATAQVTKVSRGGGSRPPHPADQGPPQGGYGESQGVPQPDPWAGGGNQGGYDDPPF